MASVLNRAALAVLALAGLVLAGAGAWFAAHLGTSGSGTFEARAVGGDVVVLGPDVLNRLDRPVTVTARTGDGDEVWIGRAAPSDAEALLGQSDRTAVTGVDVGGWSLATSARGGTAEAPALAASDIWRETVSGTGTARVSLDQRDAPETLVIATASGRPAALESVTATWQNSTWFVLAVLALLVGVLLTAAAAGALWILGRRSAAGSATHQVSAPEEARR